jgi:hypothetical protein
LNTRGVARQRRYDLEEGVREREREEKEEMRVTIEDSRAGRERGREQQD